MYNFAADKVYVSKDVGENDKICIRNVEGYTVDEMETTFKKVQKLMEDKGVINCCEGTVEENIKRLVIFTDGEEVFAKVFCAGSDREYKTKTYSVKKNSDKQLVLDKIKKIIEEKGGIVMENINKTEKIDEVEAKLKVENTESGELGKGLEASHETSKEVAKDKNVASGSTKVDDIESYKKERENMFNNLKEQFNVIKISDSAVQLAIGKIYGHKLQLELVKDNKAGNRVYLFNEVVNGVKQGVYGNECFFKPSDISKKKVRIEEYIQNMQDDYTKNINTILMVLELIEKHRVLHINTKKEINVAIKTTEQIITAIKDYMLANPCDEKIALIEVKNKKEVGIVGRRNFTAYQNFKRILEEVAPENNAKLFKDECAGMGLFIRDDNNKCIDCLRTVPEKQRILEGIRGDKMYSFKFGDEFIEKYEKAREREIGRIAESINESKSETKAS